MLKENINELAIQLENETDLNEKNKIIEDLMDLYNESDTGRRLIDKTGIDDFITN